ncbi:MAG: outer membrane protein assembly factor BamA [Flavobacteriales bacterium]|nr:outer membrane protein assembly factor BamA [Flavobacteriales bacterium]MDP4717032.1 outer membrane protein assembly factor BamA [Flavobacteriales bacterium]MDP4730692.1 outer membrane protein assembly factor BamA [Flavobacteriales bacterium]MDP4819214.1 outer membrane protein assembly factor BamA [Flavobacteriales bacterium]MDP4950475.1 outer membrane protein assembly factor BamA [Flavobacteriales bacterium]
MKIAGITVMGAEYTDAQAILLFCGLKTGQEIMIPGDEIADALRKLWKNQLFSSIDIRLAEARGDDAFLVIVVEELPKLGVFKFDGIKKGDADNIREKMKIRSGNIVNENLKATATNIIKNFYVEKGYFNAKVNIVEKPYPNLPNAVELTFDIERGNRIKIEEIEWVGADKMSVATLNRTMKNTKKAAFYHVFKSSKFLEEEYEEDKAAIVARYNKEGFRNMRIVKDSIYSVGPERLKVRITLDEGNKFYFRNITFIGNTKYRSNSLDSILNIKKGDVYNMEVLQTRLNMNQTGRDVASLYTDDGYLNFYAYPVESLVPPDSIDIEVRMGEGKQYRIGVVSVSGNTKTNDHVIYREIRTRPGDLFNRSDLIRSQRELANLNYFSQEAFDIRTNPRPDEGLVDLEYVVEEKPSDQIELSGGWGGGRVVGSLGLSFNNFSMRNFFKKEAWSPLPTGDGQRLSIRAMSNGAFFQSYNLSFTEPWLGGKRPNSLSVSGYHSVQSNGQAKYINDALNPTRQSLIITGASVVFGQRWQKPDDWFLFFGGLSYQHFDLNNYGSFFSFNNGYSNNLAANFTIERSSLSETIYPTWGSKITLSSKFTLPYTTIGENVLGKEYDYASMTDQEKVDWVEYYKIKFTANWYTSLNKHKTNKLVLHTHAGFGFLGAYNKNLGQSPFERFYLGGVFLSGFLLDGREIVNLRGYDDLSLTMPSDRVGAPVITKYGAELRYPISLNPQATIFALAFAEAGRTWTDFSDYNPFNLYKSVGGGLRIFLPMFGLLGFDYGWRLNDLPNAPNMAPGQFHFSIGMNMGEL